MLRHFAHDPADSDERRLEKVAIAVVAASCCAAGLVWGATYLFVLGWCATTALPFAFTAIVGGALAVSHVTRNHLYAVHTQLLCIIYIPAGIQWTMGGVYESGFVLVWGFLGPIGALIFFRPRKAVYWLALHVGNVAVTVAFDDFFAAHGHQVGRVVRQTFFAMNASVCAGVIFVFAGYFVATARRERQRADDLLLNILPKEIAATLKSGQQTIAEHYGSASVLFADIVGSTPLFAEMDPGAVVEWLNEVFTLLDQVLEKHGLEKIRTIGDNYMVAAGVPTRRPDHATAIARFALEMLERLEEIPPRNGRRIGFRVGIHSGPLVAGVIGKRKFQYDLWGDTVNLASRMESHGEVGRVHISAATHELIGHEIECEPRGVTNIKGRGEMQTWFLVPPAAP